MPEKFIKRPLQQKHIWKEKHKNQYWNVSLLSFLRNFWNKFFCYLNTFSYLFISPVKLWHWEILSFILSSLPSLKLVFSDFFICTFWNCKVTDFGYYFYSKLNSPLDLELTRHDCLERSITLKSLEFYFTLKRPWIICFAFFFWIDTFGKAS